MLEDWKAISTGFSAAILNPAIPVPDWLRGPEARRADKRYAVYRNNVTIGLIGALEANFPSIKRLVGAEFFAALAREYARGNPPKSRLMAEYGASFPDFLAGFEPLAKYPYMADVARLERLWLEAYNEADAAPLEGAALAAIPPQALFETRFSAHPAARLFSSPFAAVSIMSANRQDGGTPELDLSRAEYALITRPRLDVAVRHIPASTHAFLGALIAGASLGEGVGGAMSRDPDFNLAANIQGFLEAGVFTSLLQAEGISPCPTSSTEPKIC
jgi:Putative DNA-binding domain